MTYTVSSETLNPPYYIISYQSNKWLQDSILTDAIPTVCCNVAVLTFTKTIMDHTYNIQHERQRCSPQGYALSLRCLEAKFYGFDLGLWTYGLGLGVGI